MGWYDDLILAYRTVKSTGIAVASRPAFNFTGSGVTVTDDPTNSQTTITISGGTSVTMAGDVTGPSNVSVVSKIHGTTVTTAGGALTTGQVLRVTGVAAADWGALDLANTNAITGVLATTHQAVQAMGGDTSGTTDNVTVIKVHGTTVPAGGSLTTGNAAYVSGASATTYSALNLAGGSGWVTGVLPIGNQAAQTLTGDATGTTASVTVAKINGTTVTTAGGALTTGKVLRVTGVGTSDWGAVDLANASAVTGTLPTGNQAAQSLSGDASGTTASVTVAKVNGTTYPAGGSLVTGNGPYVSGASAVTYSALNLAGGSGWVTGTLPIANGGTGITSAGSANTVLTSNGSTWSFATVVNAVVDAAAAINCTKLDGIFGSVNVSIGSGTISTVGNVRLDSNGKCSMRGTGAVNRTVYHQNNDDQLYIGTDGGYGNQFTIGRFYFSNSFYIGVGSNYNFYGSSTESYVAVNNVPILKFDGNKAMFQKGVRDTVTAVSTTYQVLVTDIVVEVTLSTNDRTFTLPASATAGDRYTFVFTTLNTHTATIDGNSQNIVQPGAGTVAATLPIAGDYQELTFRMTSAGYWSVS